MANPITQAPAGSAAPIVTGAPTGLTLDNDCEVFLHELGLEESLRRDHVLENDYRSAEAAADASRFRVNDANSERLEAQSEYEYDRRQHERLGYAMAQDRVDRHEANTIRHRKLLEDANAAATAAVAKLTNARETLRTARDYLRSLPKGTKLLPSLLKTPCPNGITPKQAAANERKRAKETFFTEVARLKEARPGIEADLADYRAQLLATVEGSKFSVAFSGGRFVPRFPMAMVNAESRGNSLPVAADPWGLIVDANFERYLAEGERIIREAYQRHEWMTISEEDKRARLRELAGEVLESERLEAHFTWMARASGDDTAAFRPDISPLALLGVKGPPPPRKPRR